MQRGLALLMTLALGFGVLLPLVAPAATRAAPTELFFSEYIEGSSNNKALEIYNGTGAAVNLATAGYNVQMFFNGSTSPALTINLTGAVAAGHVYVLAQSSANATILALADQTNGSGWFNGDDAVALRRGTAVIDVIGQIGFDPGTEWGTGLTSTLDNTLRRKATVLAGDAIGPDAFDPAIEWDGFATDTFGGLGSHSVTDDSTDPTAIGAADPSTVVQGGSTTLTVTVTPGANPPSTGIVVTGDLSAIGYPDPVIFTDGGSGSFTFLATVAADTLLGTYPLPIRVLDAEERDASTTIQLTVVAAPPRIFEIQGSGHLSPMDGNAVFDVEGVVTALKPEGTRRNQGGFWMEDPEPDADPQTSNGIFVHTVTNPAVEVGDLLTVDGRVEEIRPFFEDLTITRIADASWTIHESDHALPTTVIGVDRMPPTVVIDDDSTGSVEDADAVFDPAHDGIDFWETMEGMRLSVKDAIAVGPTNDFGEIAVVSQRQTEAGDWTSRGGLLVRNLTRTGDYQPGDFNPERLLLDDALAETPELNVGDAFDSDPVGVLDQSFGAFKLLVTAEVGGVDKGLQREVAEAAGPHELAVATFNVENLSAADSDEKVAELAAQIVDNLRSPDLIAIEEMQDNSGDVDDPGGNDGTVASDLSWQRLIDAIVAAGGPVYDYRQIDPLNNIDGGVPGGNIRVGFLFHSERGLEFVDRPGGDATTDTDVVPVPNEKGARLTVSPGRVLDAALGGAKAFAATRKSLAGEFRFRGETIFVVANHFSSKGDDRPLYGHFQAPFRLTEFESGAPEDGWRHAQAQAINDFVDEILAVDAAAHVIVLGDINDFDFSETVKILTGELLAAPGGADSDGSGPTVAGTGAVMSTLFELLDEDERYSYVFEGNSQVLDQILASESLMALGPSYDVVHVNSEFADQASDHDPSVMRVAFQPRSTDTLSATSIAESASLARRIAH
jgi:predicted extracellular nuclease